jgi:hypothetical protein
MTEPMTEPMIERLALPVAGNDVRAFAAMRPWG